MLGLLGMIVLNAKRLSDHVKENIGISVILKESTKEADIAKIQKSIDASNYVKRTKYVSKAEAAEIMKTELGEDFISFLGYNPLLAAIDVYLKAEYANSDSIAVIEKELMAVSGVKEVFYQKNLVALVNENIKKISVAILSFSALLLIIAIALINNSIRLAIYSKRFLIRTMQLVGATNGFIRRPFVGRGILNGLFASFIAILLLMAVIYKAQQEVPELFELQDAELFLSLFGIVILLGIIISWLSTALAVTKYLKIKPENLH
jgi:cell division transport system permease protein